MRIANWNGVEWNGTQHNMHPHHVQANLVRGPEIAAPDLPVQNEIVFGSSYGGVQGEHGLSRGRCAVVQLD